MSNNLTNITDIKQTDPIRHNALELNKGTWKISKMHVFYDHPWGIPLPFQNLLHPSQSQDV